MKSAKVSLNQRNRLHKQFSQRLDASVIDSVLDCSDGPFDATARLEELSCAELVPPPESREKERQLDALVDLFCQLFPNVSADVVVSVCTLLRSAEHSSIVEALCEIADSSTFDADGENVTTPKDVALVQEKLLVCFPEIPRSIVQQAVEGLKDLSNAGKETLVRLCVIKLKEFGYVSSQALEYALKPEFRRLVLENAYQPFKELVKVYRENQNLEVERPRTIALGPTPYSGSRESFPQLMAPGEKGENLRRTNEKADSYRRLAHEAHEERVKNFKQAAQSWKVGGLTGRGSAAYYSEKGRQLTMEMNRLNDMASNLQVIENRANIYHEFPADQSYVVDLHGIYVSEVTKALDSEFTTWLSSHKRKSMIIITGKGNHSKQLKSKLAPTVCSYLKRSGWNFTQHDGYFVVQS